MNRYYLPMEPNNRVRPFLFLMVKPDGDRTLYTLRPTAPYYYEGDHPISLDKLLRQAGGKKNWYRPLRYVGAVMSPMEWVPFLLAGMYQSNPKMEGSFIEATVDALPHWVKLRFHRHGSVIIQFKAGLPYKVVDSTNIHVRFAAASVLRATRPLADKLQF